MNKVKTVIPSIFAITALLISVILSPSSAILNSISTVLNFVSIGTFSPLALIFNFIYNIIQALPAVTTVLIGFILILLIVILRKRSVFVTVASAIYALLPIVQLALSLISSAMLFLVSLFGFYVVGLEGYNYSYWLRSSIGSATSSFIWFIPSLLLSFTLALIMVFTLTKYLRPAKRIIRWFSFTPAIIFSFGAVISVIGSLLSALFSYTGMHSWVTLLLTLSNTLFLTANSIALLIFYISMGFLCFFAAGAYIKNKSSTELDVRTTDLEASAAASCMQAPSESAADGNELTKE